MRTKARKFITVALLAIVTVVVSWPTILKFIVQGSLESAKSSGANLSWNGLTTGASSVALDSLTVWIPGPRVKGTFAIPVSLELSRLSVALNVASLATLSPSVTYSTQLYGGSVSGEAQQVSGATRATATIENVEIGNHPQLASLGVHGGSTNGSFQEMILTPQGPAGGTFSVKIRELTIPAIAEMALLLRTTSLGTIDLDAEGTISPTKVDVPSIRLSSMFGSVVGALTASDHLSRSPSLNGSFEVSLSDHGIATLGPWLPLIPGAGLDASTSSFIVSVSSTPCSAARGSGTAVRLPSGCLKLLFQKR